MREDREEVDNGGGKNITDSVKNHVMSEPAFCDCFFPLIGGGVKVELVWVSGLKFFVTLCAGVSACIVCVCVVVGGGDGCSTVIVGNTAITPRTIWQRQQ